jgi:hypothetical protein
MSYQKFTVAAVLGVALVTLSWFLLRHKVETPPSPLQVSHERRPAVQPHPAVTTEHPRAVSPVVQNWSKKFQLSKDYFEFVSSAAKPALDGDGYAALYISRALQSCLLMKATYGKEPDPEVALNEGLASMNEASVVDSQRRTFQLCKGFFKGDAFAGLPERSGGYDHSKFWMDQAYRDNNPIAQTIHAATAKGTEVQTDVNNAVASGDPEALFRAGMLISDGHGRDSLQGFALSIAACDLGYDCSAGTNPDYFGPCVATGDCNPGTTFQDVVVNSVGSSGYADAYARAQEIETALSSGDTVSLQKFAQLR